MEAALGLVRASCDSTRAASGGAGLVWWPSELALDVFAAACRTSKRRGCEVRDESGGRAGVCVGGGSPAPHSWEPSGGRSGEEGCSGELSALFWKGLLGAEPSRVCSSSLRSQMSGKVVWRGRWCGEATPSRTAVRSCSDRSPGAPGSA